MIELTADVAPWLPTSNCQAIIGSLELLATFILFRLALDEDLIPDKGERGTILQMKTDNRGNAFNVLNGRVRHDKAKKLSLIHI